MKIVKWKKSAAWFTSPLASHNDYVIAKLLSKEWINFSFYSKSIVCLDILICFLIIIIKLEYNHWCTKSLLSVKNLSHWKLLLSLAFYSWYSLFPYCWQRLLVTHSFIERNNKIQIKNKNKSKNIFSPSLDHYSLFTLYLIWYSLLNPFSKCSKYLGSRWYNFLQNIHSTACMNTE